VVLHVNMSLRMGWPLLFRMRPWVIVHQTWIPGKFLGSIKQWCTLAAENISISKAVAAHIRARSTIIPNPYDDELFYEDLTVSRKRELVFVGRLVSDKGVNCVLTAMYKLKQRKLKPFLTVIGSGPEEAALKKLAAKLAIADQVSFLGVKQGADLVRELRRHKVIVIPSIWSEPFGIVAVEGIACGCVAVGSEGGGLKDAIGPCGITFPNGNVSALADALAELLSDETKLSNCRQQAETHLEQFTPQVIAQEYLAVMQQALNHSLTSVPAAMAHPNR